MARIDELSEIQDQLRESNFIVKKLRNEIENLELEKSEEILKNLFLDKKSEEIDLIIENLQVKISRLEIKRDDLYNNFFKNSEELLNEYKSYYKDFYIKREEKNNKIIKRKKSIFPKNKKRIDKLSLNILIVAYKKCIEVYKTIKEERKISNMLRDNFIKKKKLDELQTLMIFKKWRYLHKVKHELYKRFVKEFKLSDNEQIIFNEDKFTKINSFPKIIFNNINDNFLEKNKIEFLKFNDFQKEVINKKIHRIEFEIDDEKEKLNGLELKEEKIKKYICPICKEGKRSNRKYCSLCWRDIRSSRRSVWNSDYTEDIRETYKPNNINFFRPIFKVSPRRKSNPIYRISSRPIFKVPAKRIRNVPKRRANLSPFGLKRNPSPAVILKRSPKIGW